MLIPILVSVIVVSLMAFIGVFALSVNEKKIHKWLHSIVAFAVGTLLGTAFFDLLPEAVNEIGEAAFTYMLLGIVAFFVIERYIFWHHCHTHSHEIKPYTYLNLIGDAVHNFIDGAIIAAAYLSNFGLGIVTTLAIVLHEIPQEIGDFAILVHGGMSTRKALLYNFLSAVLAIVGALLTYVLASSIQNVLPVLLAFAGGGFLYIATADLFPELQKEEDFKKLTVQTALMILGILLIYWINGFV